MEAVAKSEAFFFITTICIALVTLVIIVLGAYLWTIINDLRYIVKKAKVGADEIAEDIKDMRDSLKDKGRTIGALLSGFFAFRAKRKRRKKGEEE